MKIVRIVSGGQSGADQGFLDACIYYGLDYGGYIPKGGICEGGLIPYKYKNLIELKTASYLKRTEANVVSSDCTLIFSYGALEGGSLKTAGFAKKHNRPYLHVDLEESKRVKAVKVISNWLKEKCPANCILNGAGSRASKSPEIQRAVELIMVDVLNTVNGFRVYPMYDSKPMILRGK